MSLSLHRLHATALKSLSALASVGALTTLFRGFSRVREVIDGNATDNRPALIHAKDVCVASSSDDRIDNSINRNLILVLGWGGNYHCTCTQLATLFYVNFQFATTSAV
eukprot:Awhi_evm1s2544